MLGDRERVAGVLTNLLDNAFKYSRAHGTIRVAVQVMAKDLVVSVSDEGKGIAPEELERIFAKFHRLERGDSRQTSGFGLGLYISRKLIQAIGGELGAESRPGYGSRFFFALPRVGQSRDPELRE
jgi:signal transduction histidine kinase